MHAGCSGCTCFHCHNTRNVVDGCARYE